MLSSMLYFTRSTRQQDALCGCYHIYRVHDLSQRKYLNTWCYIGDTIGDKELLAEVGLKNEWSCRIERCHAKVDSESREIKLGLNTRRLMLTKVIVSVTHAHEQWSMSCATALENGSTFGVTHMAVHSVSAARFRADNEVRQTNPSIRKCEIG